jgi:uncharacterized protein (DUF2236 family)
VNIITNHMHPVSHRVTAERLLLLGWSRAILLQFAHPLIAAGVLEHSGFRDSPVAAVSRLYHTIGAMLAIAFGPHEASMRALDGIRAIHTRVHGSLRHDVGPFAAGTPYSAEDPALVLWVHATLLDSMVTTFERLIGPLSAAERDDYCAESAWVATELGANPDQIPRTWSAMRDYMDCTMASGAIVIGPDARELARALLWPSIATVLPGTGSINRLFTASLLPPTIRAAYGLPWSRRRAWAAARLERMIRIARHVSPTRLAWWAAARTSADSRTRTNPD